MDEGKEGKVYFFNQCSSKFTGPCMIAGVILVLILILLSKYFLIGAGQKELSCGDGTFYGGCSINKPYFCSEGILIEKASSCGCSNLSPVNGDRCISKYQINSKNLSFNYILNGEKGKIDFIAYEGMYNYISNSSRSIVYSEGEKPNRGDFKLKDINEPEQRELLLPLVVEIQNLAKDKKDQARIAISLVQNIPYGSSEKIQTLRQNQTTGYSRYAYEVVYDKEGVCGEKVELLGFLLKELGYGTASFFYKYENHEALGIRCSKKYSVGETGYCFVETTGPSIISDNKIKYSGGLKLYSEPEISVLSEGDGLSKIYEFEDAEDLMRLREEIDKDGNLDLLDSNKLKNLDEKYGLVEIYEA